VLRVQDGLVEVLATAADGRLGGDDMDDALEAWLLDALAAAAHAGAAAAIRAQPALRFGARRALEAAKVALSVRKAASVTLPCASDGSAPSASQPPLELTLSRAELEAACGPVLARLKRPIYEAALNAQLTLQGERERADTAPRPSRGGGVGGSGSRKQKGGARAVGPAPGDLVAASDGQLERSRALPGGKALDALVMVGGVTHMLGMRTLAANLAGVEVRRTVDPMQAVARGAALQAAVTEGLATGLAVEDTWQAQLRAAYRQLERELAEKALRAGGAEGGLAEAAESASDDAWAAFPAADAFDDDDDDDADGEVIWIDEEGNEVAPP
jgi:molecular chaperone DnaK (HSP70)